MITGNSALDTDNPSTPSTNLDGQTQKANSISRFLFNILFEFSLVYHPAYRQTKLAFNFYILFSIKKNTKTFKKVLQMTSKYLKNYLFEVEIQLKSLDLYLKTPCHLSFEIHSGKLINVSPEKIPYDTKIKTSIKTATPASMAS